MSAIKGILTELDEAPGVKGSVVVTLDGMVVAEVLCERFRSDVVAGLSSFLVSTTQRCLDETGYGSMSGFDLHCTHGKVVLRRIGEAYLAVLLDQFADLHLCEPELEQAVVKLTKEARIGS